ncbi:MAG TPA: M20 family metallopeptidase [Tepidisphaeraceae bacterium]|nr:M20 family metallopeptidase [Tepidisphaeraceae bacterium]
MTETVKLLWELVSIPSVNPAYLPAGSPYSGEERVADYIAAWAKRAGLEFELQEVFPKRPNVVVRVTPKGKVKQRVLLAPHIDTVGGLELPGELFTPRIKNKRLYGRGACDTKGSVAVMLAALEELAKGEQRPANTEVVFAGLIDEECGQCGSRALVKKRFKANLALIGEPTRLQLVTAHKGVVWLELKTLGRAAHGSHPELGINAVEDMARVVLALQGDYAASLRKRRHPLLGQATINIGAMQGGSQPNIVPAECRSLVDRRTLPGETDSAVIKEIQHVIKDLGLKGTFKWRNIQGGPCLALQTDPKLPLVQIFFEATGQTQAVGADFFSDAGVLSAGGIPSVLFGPGDIAQAHTPDEWIALDELERGKNLLLKFLCRLP